MSDESNIFNPQPTQLHRDVLAGEFLGKIFQELQKAAEGLAGVLMLARDMKQLGLPDPLGEHDRALLESLMGMREGSPMQRVVIEREMGIEKLAQRALQRVRDANATGAAVSAPAAAVSPQSAPETGRGETATETGRGNVVQVDFRSRKRGD